MAVKLTRTGAGTTDLTRELSDRNGSGLLPIQASGDGATIFRVLGRVAADAPWVELKAPALANFLEAFVRVPYIRLEVTAGTGAVSLWIGER